MKIKDEPVDTPTLNTDVVTDTLNENFSNLKNDMSSRNSFNMINHDESSLSVNDVSFKTINNENSEHIFNSHSAYVDGADKTLNLKRKRTTVERDALSQSKKKRSNNFQVSKNESINAFTKTREEEKNKQRSIKSDSTKHTNQSSKRRDPTVCNICFRKFSSTRNCETHKLCYSGRYECKYCKRHFTTSNKLGLHIKKCYNVTHNTKTSNLYCNFCNRAFRTKKKGLLQSHLFHVHSELIYSNDIIKRKNLKSKNVNTHCKNDTLETDAHESPWTNNLMKSEKQNTLINKNKSSNDDDVTKTDDKNLTTEELFNNEMSSKKLRQPTLTEYLEFCNRKRDNNTSSYKFNIDYNMRNSFSSASSHNEKEVKNLEQTIHSTLEQDKNCEESKKPFVKLHADVEMMKSFLERLPNTIIEDSIINDRNDIISCYHEMPYSLRSLRTAAFTGTISNSRKRRSRDISKKSQVNTERNIRTKHDVTDKIDSDFWKTIITRFKCKNCSIILTRCDEKIRNGHQIAETETTFKENISLSSQCNSMLFRESDIRNKMVLKELEVSLERLATVPTIDIKKEKTISEVEKCNDGSFLCKVCKKSFSSKLEKHMHIKSSHIAYMSSICDARYKLKHKLLQHYLSEHLSKQNECCVCYALLSDFVELKRHLSIHCLKYVQRENDQHAIDVEIKCGSMKNNYKCFRCNMVFLTQSKLVIHQSFCILQEEITIDQKDSMKKISTFPKIIFKMQRSKNADGLTVTHDEKNNFNECSSKNSIEETNEHQISLINKEDSKIIEEEPKINEDKQNSSVNNDLVTKKIETINESQNSEKLLENDNSTFSNHDIANAQVDTIKSSIVKEQSKINEDKQNSFVNNSITRKIEIINKLQNSKKLLENNNSTISNRDTANAKVDTIKSKIITYPCDICGKQFHSDKNLQQHKRTFNYTTDICPICSTGFSSKRLLQTHITAAHIPAISKTYSFHCVFCNQGFSKKYELRPHILHLHGQEVLDTLTHDFRMSQKKLNMHTPMCNICNLVFETYDRYVDHKMYYYKNHTFTCSLCAQNFRGMYMLDHHNKLTHYSEDKRKSYNYICDICNEGFNLESHFHSHNMHVHSNEENLTEITKESDERSRCDASEVQEQISSANQRKEVEQSLNENICQICQLKCINSDDMENHISFYSNDGEYKCDRCKRQFRTVSLLYEHRKLTHICRDTYNGHVCHICGEVMETAILLECHKKHFHLNDIICNNVDDRKNCEQTLSSNSNEVIQHRLQSNDIHNTVTYRFDCLFCDMKFLSANAIQAHIIQTHIDDLFVKHNKSLKSTLSIKDDNTRKQFIAQQLVKVDQASTSTATSAAITTSVATIITPTSATATLTPVSVAATITLPSTTGATITLPPIAAATLTSASVTAVPVIATRFEDNYVQFLQNNISNNILDKNGAKGKTVIELPNQMNATFSADNKITQNMPVLLPINGIRNNISTPVSSSSQFNKSKTSILCIKPANSPRKNDKNHLQSESINKVKTNILSSMLKSDKLKVVSVIQPNGLLKSVVVPQTIKGNAIINEKPELMSNYNSNYVCPLCPLKYPSLLFFHAHLRYTHANFIRTDIINPQLNQSTQDESLIECLLCLDTFTDENKYKSHLKDSHTRIPKKNVKKKDDDKNSTPKATPEIITVDDNDNAKNSSNQPTVEATTVPEKQNEKIGKLRVKPFAKIVENLSMECALKQSKEVSYSS